MPWIREERLQIGALGLVKLAVLTSTSYNFNFQVPLFEEGGCIVNLSWLVSGYSRYKDRLLALKNGEKSAFFSMKDVFRGDFQAILTAFPTFTHGKWKMALFRNKPLFDLENWSTGTFFFSLKNTCPSCVWKWRVFNRWPISRCSARANLTGFFHRKTIELSLWRFMPTRQSDSWALFISHSPLAFISQLQEERLTGSLN